MLIIEHKPISTIRASIGTLAKLGASKLKLSVEPATAYLLTQGGCLGRCAFCPQWINEGMLSHLEWPIVNLEDVIRGQRRFKRICIQSTLKRYFWREVRDISSLFDVPVSISINPVNLDILKELSKYSEMIGIGLDAMSPKILKQVKKPGSWLSYMTYIRNALKVFGKNHVHVHLIAGMGEDPRDAIRLMIKIHELGANIALFSFTPVRGTPMGKRSPPSIEYYRFLQIVRYFLSEGIPLEEIAKTDPDDYKEAFLTSGCPSCNRPFYNERPRGPIYNFPSKELLKSMWETTRKEVERSLGYIRFLP